MTIDLDLIIETEDNSVDMKTGLASMQGVSDTVRCIAESILTEKVPERKTSKSSVRTTLKQSFKGSYGHVFALDVNDQELQNKLRIIGHSAFVELISYFISESLYRESPPLSETAQTVLDGLGEKEKELIRVLRTSSLKAIHSVPTRFNHDIKIRYRKSRDDQTVIARFDRNSADVLQATRSNEKVDLKVVITRLNIHTGNGRFQPQGEDETSAFGFGIEYKEVSVKAKKVFSENLDYNNGLEKNKWKYLGVTVSPIKLKDGSVVKYIVRGFHEN